MVTDTAARLAVPAASGLRVTWLGHSSTIIELDGARILTDPMWGERASPSRWVGPSRMHRPPLALAELPPIDAVSSRTSTTTTSTWGPSQALGARGVTFHVPLGVGAHLAAWGIPAAQIVEHDWWQDATIAGGVRIVSTPARHFNGRGIPWRVGALWTSWSIVGPHHRLFFSGDTGLTDGFSEVARREGPFDVAMLEIGQYHESWGSIHLGPEGALEAFALPRRQDADPHPLGDVRARLPRLVRAGGDAGRRGGQARRLRADAAPGRADRAGHGQRRRGAAVDHHALVARAAAHRAEVPRLIALSCRRGLL